MLAEKIAAAAVTGQVSELASKMTPGNKFGVPRASRQAEMLATCTGSRSVGCQLWFGNRGANAAACCPDPAAISRTTPLGGR